MTEIETETQTEIETEAETDIETEVGAEITEPHRSQCRPLGGSSIDQYL